MHPSDSCPPRRAAVVRGSRARPVLIVVIAGVAMSGLAVSSAAAESFAPTPGTVVVRDRMGQNDSILFYFPVSEASSAEQRIALATERAAVPNRRIEERDTSVDGARLFVLD